MENNIVRYCRRCKVETERYAYGHCKPCNAVRGRAYRQNNVEQVKTYAAATKARYRTNNKDRDPYDGTEKRCSKCRETFLRTKVMWSPSSTEPDGLNDVCKDCVAIKGIKRRAKKQGQILNLPENFTGKHLRELKQRQGNRCYVCNKLENGEKLHLDHNHTTGKLRGYACGPCNTEILAGLDALFLLDPTIIDHSTIKRILCDAPAEYLYC